MKRLRAAPRISARISVGLVCAMLGILGCAHYIGLLPDPDQERLRRRIQMVETTALCASAMIAEDDFAGLQALLEALVRRNAHLQSAAARSANGKILIEAGDHCNNWPEDRSFLPNDQLMPLPLFRVDESVWGAIEFRYAPLYPDGITHPLRTRLFGLLVFCGAFAFAIFHTFLCFVLRNIEPTRSVPWRVIEALGGSITVRNQCENGTDMPFIVATGDLTGVSMLNRSHVSESLQSDRPLTELPYQSLSPLSSLSPPYTQPKQPRERSPAEVNDTRPDRHGITSTLPVDIPEYGALVQMFIDSLSDTLDHLQHAWSVGDYDRLSRLSRRLKGSGGTMGFAAFTKPAGELEQQARSQNDESIRHLLQELEQITAAIQRPETCLEDIRFGPGQNAAILGSGRTDYAE